jgi:hypothetical protein
MRYLLNIDDYRKKFMDEDIWRRRDPPNLKRKEGSINSVNDFYNYNNNNEYYKYKT